VKALELLVSPAGVVRFVYSDELAALAPKLGPLTTARASHVEPAGAGWEADLAPVDGPVLGPYGTRAAALAAEVDWLRAHGVPVPA
jgi:hypothetical protein